MKIKKLFVGFLFACFLNTVNAQDYSKLESIQLKVKSDYDKTEILALECSNYILNSQLDVIDKDLNHVQAQLFIIKWMEGTPDYSFEIDETIGKATKSNSSLLGVYLASSLKYVLENKEKSSDAKEVKFNSVSIFLNYCEDSSKKVKLNGDLKKMIKAKNENSLREFLKI